MCVMKIVCIQGSEFFSLRVVPFFKRDPIKENHCLFQLPPFDVHAYFIVAKPFDWTNLGISISNG